MISLYNDKVEDYDDVVVVVFVDYFGMPSSGGMKRWLLESSWQLDAEPDTAGLPALLAT